MPSTELASVFGSGGADTEGTVRRLNAMQHSLEDLAVSSRQIAAEIDAIAPSWFGPVADAHAELHSKASRAAEMLGNADIAARLVPDMVGISGGRSYFLAIQTPSEARATGGLLGAFAIVDARNGRVSTPTLGQNAELENPRVRQVNLGSEFNDLYTWTHAYTDNRNNNISPSFPDAARIWIANWKHQTGQLLDGAIAIDPIALSYVLDVTGPVTLPDGEKITADNVVPITLSTSYERFAGDNAERKAYLQTIAKATVEQISNTTASTGALLEALGHGVSDRRIMIYSTRPEEQELLESTDLGHQLPDSMASLADVTIGNVAGNKIDYYLKREISYAADACTGETRGSTVTVKLTNTLTDLSLPKYVIGSMGAPSADLPLGTNFANVQFTLTKGANVLDLTVNGGPEFYWEGSLQGHPVAVTQVRIPAGKSVEVKLRLNEPTSAHGDVQVPIQPLVDTPTVNVDVPTCGDEK
ncbi:hypothetical protein GORHZ_127_00270 [Gordonia rhizosphera NBRC 16068]|uniref:DUF4012 domain-containing protein n=1 Tax=Gordonia rhizosphera NBRC 16068 TaxID=1108045 RepID=K6WXT6_9ACTN|nr:hypothetical protein GORHZ_127_00270 [Gordonia rhizosphera NBRC 16068]